MRIKGKKAESEELAPSAIIGLILSAIFIIFVAVVLFNMWFGGFTSPEQKARIALIKISEAIPDGSGEEFKEIDINLPDSYTIIAEPLGNGLTNISLYKTTVPGKISYVDNKLVKADNVFRAHLNGLTCTEDTLNIECLESGRSKIWCESLGQSGSRFGIKTTYRMYSNKISDGKYAFLFKHDCPIRPLKRGEIRDSAGKCHKFGEERALVQ